jgi:hypothetical protein
MSREEVSAVLEEILATSRALVELEEPEDGAPSKLCEELRARRRALIARLRSEDAGQDR